jgi:2-polyprenyl-6-methoxyphenol hydroxylase-like FAD-dependent oxidoreductase
VLDRGARIDRLFGADLCGRTIMDMRYERWRPGAFGLGVHRASLFDVLYEGALAAGTEIRTGVAVVQIASFDRPVLVTAAGDRHGPYDMAVVADGAGSTLRQQVRPRSRAPTYPWGAVWATAQDPHRRFNGALHQRYDGASTMIGILPVGRRPGVAGDHVSFFWSLPVSAMDAFLSGDLSAWRNDVVRMWPEAEPILAQLHSRTCFSRAVYKDMAFGRWDRGAVVLIGDAAHGMSPQLGQGANLALIDAVELADRVPSPTRIAGYQRARRLQTGPYQLLSRLLTPLFQSSSAFWSWFRTYIFAPLSQAPVLRGHAAHVLAGLFRLGPTPPKLRP